MKSEVIVSDKSDGLEVVPLDAFNILDVDFAKIDVEGHTFALLQGSRETLSSSKPVIFVELFETERQECESFLKSMGYEVKLVMEDSNYLYVHSERQFSGELPI